MFPSSGAQRSNSNRSSLGTFTIRVLIAGPMSINLPTSYIEPPTASVESARLVSLLDTMEYISQK